MSIIIIPGFIVVVPPGIKTTVSVGLDGSPMVTLGVRLGIVLDVVVPLGVVVVPLGVVVVPLRVVVVPLGVVVVSKILGISSSP